MEFFIPIIAFLASLLTFFSGFGLGTIMVPVFLMFFPVELAIALSGIIHLLNNMFKISLIWSYIDKNVLLRFGAPALLAAFAGATLLTKLSSADENVHYILAGLPGQTTYLKITIGVMLFVFALVELIPGIKGINVSGNRLMVGGALSGFAGGLSGHQGALRTIFLVKAGLSTEAFIATGISIALLVDLTRIPIYFTTIDPMNISENASILISSTLAAFVGALIGRRLLKKVKIVALQTLIGVLILFVSIALGFGII
ncbi:MAG: sulfite exporter TauE/SafE family protein [Flavobacteriales bacterium]|nr:sulfite exporter TauE/SafE family protein [Flavobacteriales bacterium]